jgi:hypothetical protein
MQPQPSIQSEFVPCPKCGNSDVHKVKYTWWGGLLGPSILHHVKCDKCSTVYNGKTGKSNTTGIIIYSVALFVIVCLLLGGCALLGGLLNNSDYSYLTLFV